MDGTTLADAYCLRQTFEAVEGSKSKRKVVAPAFPFLGEFSIASSQSSARVNWPELCRYRSGYPHALTTRWAHECERSRSMTGETSPAQRMTSSVHNATADWIQEQLLLRYGGTYSERFAHVFVDGNSGTGLNQQPFSFVVEAVRGTR